jgi:hypothetical protein
VKWKQNDIYDSTRDERSLITTLRVGIVKQCEITTECERDRCRVRMEKEDGKPTRLNVQKRRMGMRTCT